MIITHCIVNSIGDYVMKIVFFTTFPTISYIVNLLSTH